MKQSYIPIFSIIGLLIATSAFAQSNAKVSNSYILGPDDVVDISVMNHTDLNKTLTILPDGSITFSWAGRFMATGETPAVLAAQIQKQLEKRYNNVDVAVDVAQVHSQRARVTGAVSKPGVYDIKPKWRVLDLITTAGGLNARPAQISGRIVRADGGIIPLNIAQAVAMPDGPQNPRLESDDLVLLDQVDPTQNKVYAMGQVNKPGAYELGDDGLSLFSLLSQAGSTTPTAALKQAYILHGQTEIPMDLWPTIMGGKEDKNVQAYKLQAGDVLFIPEIQSRIAIVGEVNKPGYYPLPERPNFTALEGLSLAGGQTQNGDLRKARIIRNVDGKATVLPLDLDKVGQPGYAANKIVLQPDDVLYVSARGSRVELKDAFASLAYMAVRFIR